MTEDTSPENLRKFLESDDPAMVQMGLSMAKSTKISDDLLALICGLHMWHDETKVRSTAKSIFMKHAPDNVKTIIKEKWRSNYRTRQYPVSDFCTECGQPRTSRHKSCCVRFASVNVLEDLFAGLKDTSLDNIFLWVAAKTSLMWEKYIREIISLHYPSESLNLFLDMLKHDDRYVRSNAVHDIGVITGNTVYLMPNGSFKISLETEKITITEIEIEEVIDALIQALEDKEEGIRGKAAAVLSTFKKKRIIEPLITTLANDTVGKVRGTAAHALGEIGDKQAVEPLIKASGDKDYNVRQHAKEALKKLGHEVE